MPLGHASGGLILGVSVFYLLRAFANGGSAMTGTEAISNGVSIFREPQARNARTTLVVMSTILGRMFLGVSVLAALTHAVPFGSGTPTVVSEIGKLVYGSSALGRVAVLLAAGGHRPDPDPGRQHQLHRLPVPGQLRGRGLVPAPPADGAGPPAGVLQRDHRAGGGVDRPAASPPTPRWRRSSRCTPSGSSPASPWPAPAW